MIQLLTYLATAYSKPGSLKVPKASEVLKSLSLPFLAEAMEIEENEAKDKAFVENLKKLAERTGGKVEIKTK